MSVADLEQQAAALRAKCEAMLASVEAWQVPTPEHESLKTFMREQITQSIAFDCQPPASEPTPPITGDEWLQRERTDIYWVERCAARTGVGQGAAAITGVIDGTHHSAR